MTDTARATLGVVLVSVLFLCVASLAAVRLFGHRYVGRDYGHVVVEVSNVSGIARVDVNCRRAASVDAGGGPTRVDLGWLRSDEWIFLSEYNERGAAAWGFKIIVNGKVVQSFSTGHAGVTGEGTGPFAIALAKEFTGDGDLVGTLGCSPPGLVSKSLGNYQLVPLMHALLKRKKPPLLESWDPPGSPYALVETLSDLLSLLALSGFVAALSLRRVRELIRRHVRISAAIGAFTLVNGILRTFGPETLLVALRALGLILLLLSAVLLVWPHTGSRWLSSYSTPAPKPNPE